MHENAQIAVVIPCYNHADLLRRTLAALASQTLKPIDVLVVDDGSQDNPEPVVQSFANVLPIHYLRLPVNHGAPYARNEGARFTTAPFLLFLDADAELVPEALEDMAMMLERHPEAAYAYADFMWGSKSFRGRPFDPDVLKKYNYIHTSSLIRRSAFPGFDETLKKFQDWDLWLTMAEKGNTGVWIDHVLYRIEPRSQGYSHWLPRFVYHIPWKKLGFEPKVITSFRNAEDIIKQKHSL